MHTPCCNGFGRNAEFCMLYWILILHPPYEPFLTLLLFFKVCICQNLYRAMIKALPSKQNINFQWCWSLENTNDSIKNVCLWKWEKPYMRTWIFIFFEAELFLAILGIMVSWLLKYILVAIYSLLFSGLRTVVLFDFLLSCVPSYLISLFHSYIFGKLEYYTAVKGSCQSWSVKCQGFQCSHPIALVVCMVCVEWGETFQSTHNQTCLVINVKLENKMCKKGYIHMRSPHFCQPLVLV